MIVPQHWSSCVLFTPVHDGHFAAISLTVIRIPREYPAFWAVFIWESSGIGIASNAATGWTGSGPSPRRETPWKRSKSAWSRS